jgi:predicted nucleic acid-binding protein
MADLLDASVWVPLSAPDRLHYSRARRYWDHEGPDELAFCRMTALALLRRLTNPRILGEAALCRGSSCCLSLPAWMSC